MALALACDHSLALLSDMLMKVENNMVLNPSEKCLWCAGAHVMLALL